jgi:hypothetical protein
MVVGSSMKEKFRGEMGLLYSRTAKWECTVVRGTNVKCGSSRQNAPSTSHEQNSIYLEMF